VIEGFRKGFRGQTSVFFLIVAVGALTAARRGEVLALRWIDLDIVNKTLTIQRALEQTKKHGIRFKEPKTKRGRRTYAERTKKADQSAAKEVGALSKGILGR
jgi:integrase